MGDTDVVTISATVETDDRPGLDRIVNHLNGDSRFQYMLNDGGRLKVERFIADELTFTMEGQCGGCEPMSIIGTRRHVELSLAEDYAEVIVKFTGLSEELTTAVNALLVKKLG